MTHARLAKTRGDIAVPELNLVPYLDIMLNIIMFMLLTYQVVAELRVIQSNPPKVARTGDPDVRLTVGVTKEGFELRTSDGHHAESVPLTSKDAWDYAALTDRLTALKANLTEVDDTLIVEGESDIVYDTITKTLDAARTTSDGRKSLFPTFVFALSGDY